MFERVEDGQHPRRGIVAGGGDGLVEVVASAAFALVGVGPADMPFTPARPTRTVPGTRSLLTRAHETGGRNAPGRGDSAALGRCPRRSQGPPGDRRRWHNLKKGATMDWPQHAACLGEDPKLFSPPAPGARCLSGEQAKAVCRDCAVIKECLQWALDTNQDAAVWGGMSEEEHRRIRRSRQREQRVTG